MGSEFISKDDFAKVLSSRDLGLQLNEVEVAYLAEQFDFYGDGNISCMQVIPQLPEVLQMLYNQRAEQSMVRLHAHNCQCMHERSDNVWCMCLSKQIKTS